MASDPTWSQEWWLPEDVWRFLHEEVRQFRQWKDDLPLECLTATCDRPCHAILDTGASRCIIGEKVLFRLRQHLPQELDSQIKKVESQVKFRFGNNQSLTSAYRVQIPLLRADQQARKLWLSVEVVPGETPFLPFLFSKRAFKQLGGILDTTKDKCFLSRLSRVFPLELSKTDLYLIDVSKLCSPPQSDDENFVATHDGNINVSWGKVDTRDGVHESSQHKTEGRDAVSKFPRFVSGSTRIFPKPRVSNFHSATPVLIPSRDRQDARQCHADESQECLGVNHRSPHVTPAGSCSSTGDSTRDRGRERPGPIDEQFRTEPDHDQHAAGTTEPTYGGLVAAQTLSSSSPPTRSRAAQALTAGVTTTARTNPGNIPRSTPMMNQVMQALPSNNFGLDPSRGGRGVSDRDRASRSSRTAWSAWWGCPFRHPHQPWLRPRRPSQEPSAPGVRPKLFGGKSTRARRTSKSIRTTSATITGLWPDSTALSRINKTSWSSVKSVPRWTIAVWAAEEGFLWSILCEVSSIR